MQYGGGSTKYPCSIQDVGQTKRVMAKRIQEHFIIFQQDTLNILCLNIFVRFITKKVKGTLCWGIEKYKKHWRVSNTIQVLSQNESKYIYDLNTLLPCCLTAEFDIHCFICDR